MGELTVITRIQKPYRVTRLFDMLHDHQPSGGIRCVTPQNQEVAFRQILGLLDDLLSFSKMRHLDFRTAEIFDFDIAAVA